MLLSTGAGCSFFVLPSSIRKFLPSYPKSCFGVGEKELLVAIIIMTGLMNIILEVDEYAYC